MEDKGQGCLWKGAIGQESYISSLEIGSDYNMQFAGGLTCGSWG